MIQAGEPVQVKALDYSLLGDTYLAVSLEQLRALLLFGAMVLTAYASSTDQIGAAAKGQRLSDTPAVHP